MEPSWLDWARNQNFHFTSSHDDGHQTWSCCEEGNMDLREHQQLVRNCVRSQRVVSFADKVDIFVFMVNEVFMQVCDTMIGRSVVDHFGTNMDRWQMWRSFRRFSVPTIQANMLQQQILHSCHTFLPFTAILSVRMKFRVLTPILCRTVGFCAVTLLLALLDQRLQIHGFWQMADFLCVSNPAN